MNEREARAARNEALLREVNDRIEEAGGGRGLLPRERPLEFRCECGREDCHELVSMTVGQYEHVRSDNDRFAVVPGHQDDAIERVVESGDGYVIVDKLPAAERFVGADGKPRSGA